MPLRERKRSSSSPGESHFDGASLRLSPDSRVRWECTEGPGQAAGTRVTFRLVEVPDGRTQIELGDDGWNEGDRALKTCNTLWGILLGHLRAYAETAGPSPAFR
jgi:uncharacterized protein YndB with AHSA1/START domain